MRIACIALDPPSRTGKDAILRRNERTRPKPGRVQISRKALVKLPFFHANTQSFRSALRKAKSRRRSPNVPIDAAVPGYCHGLVIQVRFRGTDQPLPLTLAHDKMSLVSSALFAAGETPFGSSRRSGPRIKTNFLKREVLSPW